MTEITKTQLKRALVAERKAMRVKQQASVFNRRTASMFQSQKRRAEKMGRFAEIDYDLAELRSELTSPTQMPWYVCNYCHAPLGVSKFVLDHMTPVSRGGSFGIKNLAAACPSCNFQKGIMTNPEFGELLDAIKDFPPEVQADIKRRLTIGGKWGVRV